MAQHRMEHLMDMEKITIPTVAYFRAALLMVFLMALVDSSCLMVIITRAKSNMEELMAMVHIKLIILLIKEILKIM